MKLIINNPNPVRLAVGDDVMLDVRLTWAARGIFIHLAQLPNGTSISAESLSSASNPTADVRAALKRLNACGYITFEKVDEEHSYAILKEISIASPQKPKAKKKVVPGASVRFEEFWKIYPKKDYKIETEAVWRQMGLDLVASDVIAGLKAQIVRDGWSGEALRERLRFIPSPPRWLRNEGWKNMTQAETAAVSTEPPVFKVIGRTYTLEIAPKRDDFASDADFAMYEQAYRSWKQKQTQ